MRSLRRARSCLQPALLRLRGCARLRLDRESLDDLTPFKQVRDCCPRRFSGLAFATAAAMPNCLTSSFSGGVKYISRRREVFEYSVQGLARNTSESNYGVNRNAIC